MALRLTVAWRSIRRRTLVLLYPMEELLLPDGSRIEGVGVVPDVELTIKETVNDAFIERVALAELVP